MPATATVLRVADLIDHRSDRDLGRRFDRGRGGAPPPSSRGHGGVDHERRSDVDRRDLPRVAPKAAVPGPRRARDRGPRACADPGPQLRPSPFERESASMFPRPERLGEVDASGPVDSGQLADRAPSFGGMTTECGPAALQVGRVFNPGCHRFTVQGGAGSGVGHRRVLGGALGRERHEPRLGTLVSGARVDRAHPPHAVRRHEGAFSADSMMPRLPAMASRT